MSARKSVVFVVVAVVTLALGVASVTHAQKKMDLPPELMEQLNMAMENMAKVMLDMKMEDRPKYMMKKQANSIASGKEAFNTALGRNQQTCNACHPGGGTTGGEAEIPMKGRFEMNPKLPIPTLIGAAARFPKYKVPNDAVITIEQMNNNCIKMFMMGDGLELMSQKARDLAAYVSTLSNGEEIAIGKMEMMMKK
jgi:thiosulfate dehydrogenase